VVSFPGLKAPREPIGQPQLHGAYLRRAPHGVELALRDSDRVAERLQAAEERSCCLGRGSASLWAGPALSLVEFDGGAGREGVGR
jgi:hypothetical protein